jgi:glycosyltransferase involved in cell wall biosynthesis
MSVNLVPLCCLSDLPSPPEGKTGWPWTVESNNPAPHMGTNQLPWPKISIVTPSYNQGDFIEETIRSILLQRYPNLEFIIVDGASSDGTVAIIRKYDRWISHWTSEPDRGQVDALHKGFSDTSGDLLNWVNSDDMLLPNALFTVAELSSLSSSIDIITGARLLRNAGTGAEQVQIIWTDSWPLMTLGYPSFPQEATFFSRRIWSKIGNFDERLNYFFDTAFYARVLKLADRIMVTSCLLGLMHMHPAQKQLRHDARKRDATQIIETEYLPRRMSLRWLLWRAHSTRYGVTVAALVRAMVYHRARTKLLIAEYDYNTWSWNARTL